MAEPFSSPPASPSSSTPPPVEDMQAIESDLRAWVEQQLNAVTQDTSSVALQWAALDGDAGFRKFDCRILAADHGK